MRILPQIWGKLRTPLPGPFLIQANPGARLLQVAANITGEAYGWNVLSEDHRRFTRLTLL